MELTKYSSAYYIAHRLPGRIRIRIPALKKMPDDWRRYLVQAADLIRMKKGIYSADIRPISGSLLVEYDPAKLDEAAVLKWLETLVTGFLKLGTPLKPPNDANIRLRFARLRDQLIRQENAISA